MLATFAADAHGRAPPCPQADAVGAWDWGRAAGGAPSVARLGVEQRWMRGPAIAAPSPTRAGAPVTSPLGPPERARDGAVGWRRPMSGDQVGTALVPAWRQDASGSGVIARGCASRTSSCASGTERGRLVKRSRRLNRPVCAFADVVCAERHLVFYVISRRPISRERVRRGWPSTGIVVTASRASARCWSAVGDDPTVGRSRIMCLRAIGAMGGHRQGRARRSRSPLWLAAESSLSAIAAW